uniref:Uncharacterized protein n=1 Tax=Arundo donax TaxID=35708 RepID=A0A0A8XTS0_ARUDO
MYTHDKKAEATYDHFNNLLGKVPHREYTLDWEKVSLPRHNLQHLEVPIMEDEIHAAINELHDEKAPGPDRYIRMFFKENWEVVKEDVLAAVQLFQNQHTHTHTNSTY